MALIREFTCDQMVVKVFDTRKEMGDAAGYDAGAYMKELLKSREYINVMFAAAPSQNETLAALLAQEDLDWSRINAFHMDEYVGLDKDHPAGFRNFLNRSVFGLRQFRSINLINGNAENPQAEAERYSKLLEMYPLDVCLLGVGENGHIAFNDPPVADFNDPVYVKVVELEDRCRKQQVNDGCFEKLEQVPTHALTVTIPGLTQATAMFCSVPAATKADAINHMVHDEVSTKCPATILRTHACAKLYVDKAAGAFVIE